MTASTKNTPPPGLHRTSQFYLPPAAPQQIASSAKSATPGDSSPFVWPRNGTELAQALQSFADERYVGMLDPRTGVEVSQTITVQQRNADGNPWGVNGNYAKLNWVGPGGQDMLVYRGVKGMAQPLPHDREAVALRQRLCRRAVRRLPQALGSRGRPRLDLQVHPGEPVHQLRDTRHRLRRRGVRGLGLNLHAENHRGDGIAMVNTYTPGEHQGIVSNVMLIHPNSSRNNAAGILAVQSANIFMGSFVLNGAGGVVAPDGLRYAAACNGENTGESVFVVPYKGWGSEVLEQLRLDQRPDRGGRLVDRPACPGRHDRQVPARQRRQGRAAAAEYDGQLRPPTDPPTQVLKP